MKLFDRTVTLNYVKEEVDDILNEGTIVVIDDIPYVVAQVAPNEHLLISFKGNRLDSYRFPRDTRLSKLPFYEKVRVFQNYHVVVTLD